MNNFNVGDVVYIKTRFDFSLKCEIITNCLNGYMVKVLKNGIFLKPGDILIIKQEQILDPQEKINIIRDGALFSTEDPIDNLYKKQVNTNQSSNHFFFFFFFLNTFFI